MKEQSLCFSVLFVGFRHLNGRAGQHGEACHNEDDKDEKYFHS